MRRFFFAAILSLITVLCISATVAEFHNADSMDLASSCVNSRAESGFPANAASNTASAGIKSR